MPPAKQRSRATKTLKTFAARNKRVNWRKFMHSAYVSRHTDIGKFIAHRDGASFQEQLLAACTDGNWTFASKCLSDNRDRGQDVESRDLMNMTYNKQHSAIVKCYNMSGPYFMYLPTH